MATLSSDTHPTLALVNNIEADHLENYNGDFEEIEESLQAIPQSS